MKKNKRRIIISILIYFILLSSHFAQTNISIDTLSSSITKNSLEKNEISWDRVLKSAVIPGLGQVDQDNLSRAIIFYGLGLTFFYKMAYSYYQYQQRDNPEYKNLFYRYLGLYTQLYLINMLDVTSTELKSPGKKWQGSMFSEKPLKSPWGAVTRSVILPGWGQIYNESYLKACLCFAVVFDFGRKVYLNNQRYQKSNRQNKSLLERRIVNSWYLGLAYLLTMVDAFVDAYLYKFDQTMELTIQPDASGRTYSIHLSIIF
jgi:hypothetical protein